MGTLLLKEEQALMLSQPMHHDRSHDGPAMVKALHDADICVRSYKAANLKNCLRITITTDEVVRKVVAVMTEEAKKNA